MPIVAEGESAALSLFAAGVTQVTIAVPLDVAVVKAKVGTLVPVVANVGGRVTVIVTGVDGVGESEGLGLLGAGLRLVVSTDWEEGDVDFGVLGVVDGKGVEEGGGGEDEEGGGVEEEGAGEEGGVLACGVVLGGGGVV